MHRFCVNMFILCMYLLCIYLPGVSVPVYLYTCGVFFPPYSKNDIHYCISILLKINDFRLSFFFYSQLLHAHISYVFVHLFCQLNFSLTMEHEPL